MGVYFVIAVVYIGYHLLKEALEKPAPQGRYFDWDAYQQDVRNGITAEEQMKKCRCGAYYTTIPKVTKSK